MAGSLPKSLDGKMPVNLAVVLYAVVSRSSSGYQLQRCVVCIDRKQSK